MIWATFGNRTKIKTFVFLYLKLNKMKYSYSAKNKGKDLIYINRLKIAEKMGLDIRKAGSSMYSYLMQAELGIILQ